MPEHLRALIVILVLAGGVFALARKPALDLIARDDFVRRRNLWFSLTLVAFLAGDFWLYAIIVGLLLLFVQAREENPVALFFALLFVIPNFPKEIPGLGMVNYLFALDHARLLALVILLPTFLSIQRRNEIQLFRPTWPDRIIIAYLAYCFVLAFRYGSMSGTLREGFYLLVDVFLPYYVVSRTLKDLRSFHDALLGFVLAAMVLACVGLFEFLRHWLLYDAVIGSLDLADSATAYLSRDGLLRAMASVAHPIALGYVMAVSIGFFLLIKHNVRSGFLRGLGGLLLTAGLVAPLSRGPWIGAAVSVFTYIATGRYAARRLALLGIFGITSLPLLALVPGAERILDFLPFAGTVDEGSIDYRKQLIDNSISVIERNAWFGSINYLQAPEMQAMIQGQGIVDVVNTYIGVALETGLVGLILFLGFFVSVLIGIRKAYRLLPDADYELRRLGRALFATMAGVLVTISTVSSISIIPLVYWSLAGLGVAYMRLTQAKLA